MSEFIITDKAVKGKIEKEQFLDNKDFDAINSRKDLMEMIKKHNRDISKIEFNIKYEDELRKLQVELGKLQAMVVEKQMRIAVIFEGRDAAGKGGTIKRFMEHLNPRINRVVALSRPSDLEGGQWYFQRYIKQLPNKGEIVFFDRSWYNRAVVEPVMGFCSETEYQRFMRQVPEFEHMLFEDGVHLIKFWFSISKDEQSRRFFSRKNNPLKQWKMSPVDERGQEFWDRYTYYKEQMFSRTHNSFSPWVIVKTNTKKEARLESMRYLLSRFEYPGKTESETRILPDPNIVMRFHRSVYHVD